MPESIGMPGPEPVDSPCRRADAGIYVAGHSRGTSKLLDGENNLAE